MRRKPVVVIGAGPAGLSCAANLVMRGENVVVIDDNPQPGGQYFRQLPQTYVATGDSKLVREHRRFGELVRVLQDPRVRYLPLTTAWAAPSPLTIAYSGSHETGRIEASAVVLATGAQDRPFPFPGWTLPGVISAGGSLNLAKGNGLIPSGKVVVAGNGPLVLVAAGTLAAAGAAVTHVVEAKRTGELAVRVAGHALGAPSLILKGIGYRASMLKANTRFRSGKMVARAFGSNCLEEVELAPVGRDGRPSSGTRKRVEASVLVVGYGLMPSAELSRLIGCRMIHSRSLGGWVPERSNQLITSVPGVYAVGDGAGIGGVEIAIIEGALAAEAIAGRVDPAMLKSYKKLNQFRVALSHGYETTATLSAADPDTIVCRCEELRLGELLNATKPSDRDLGRVKAVTRLGMGRCQGRNCLASASALLGLDEQPVIAYPRVRPPVRPVRIRDLISDKSIGPARIPDEAGRISQQEQST